MQKIIQTCIINLTGGKIIVKKILNLKYSSITIFGALPAKMLLVRIIEILKLMLIILGQVT